MSFAVKPRNLRFFVIDDQQIKIDPNLNVDILRSKSNAPDRDDPGVPTINRWVVHCEHAYNHDGLEFDGLSIDVFFQDDTSDPQKILDPGCPPMIPAGLCHGLAALAQRRADDGQGNIYPLAWEVRTASPTVIADLPGSLKGEIVRNYGLLLAIANSPSDGEGFLGLEGDPSKKSNAIELIEMSFANQPETSGGGLDMIKRLLPDWRKRFHVGVKTGVIRISPKRIRQLIQDVSDGKIPEEGLFQHPRVSIDICNIKGFSCDTISIGSIFSDKKVNSKKHFAEYVTPWLDEICKMKRTIFADHIDAAHRGISRLASSLMGESEAIKGEKSDWDMQSDEVRALVLFGYYICAAIDYTTSGSKKRFFFPSEFIDFAEHWAGSECKTRNNGSDNRPDNHSHKISRSFNFLKDLGHVQCKTFREFRNSVLKNISSQDIDLRLSSDLLSAVAELLSLQEFDETILEKAPGVHEQLSATMLFP